MMNNVLWGLYPAGQSYDARDLNSSCRQRRGLATFVLIACYSNSHLGLSEQNKPCPIDW